MPETVEKLVQSIEATMGEMKKTNAQVQDELKVAAKTAGEDAKAAIAKAEELAQKIQSQSQSILDMEQRLTENVNKGKAPVQTLGQMVIKSEGFKAFASGNGGNQKFRIEANTIIGQEGSPPENSDTLVAPQRLPGIIPGAFRKLSVRDVLPQGVTGSNNIQYTRELAFTNNAAERNEGVQKPESALTFELVDAPIRTIAHFLKVSKQVLDDAPALQSYIDTRLRYGVELRYDNQLINGNGTTPNISGILDTGNHTVFTPTAGENALDSLNRMIEAVGLQDYNATGIMLNTADWHAIERLKVGSADDRYLIGNPSGMMGPNLWGLPVVVSNNVPAGTAIVGAFDIAYQVWNRMGTVVEIFEQDVDNVQKNLLTVRAEARGTLATYRPASVQAGLLVDVGT